MSADPWFRCGENCWRREPASKVAFLVDGERYFDALHQGLRLARRSIYVLGWDIDSRVQLLRGRQPDDLPATLAELIDALVARRPGLEVRILIWDSSILFALEREWLTRYRLGWRTSRRVRFELDANHPFGASHHQKVVVIDDSLAFVGGLDLTRRRWDTRRHRPEDPRREDPGGQSYGPFHDIQLALAGPAAASLGSLARWRWSRATGRRQRRGAEPHELWPSAVEPHLTDVEVAIARSWPEHDGCDEVREVERLYLDSIGRARRCIYVENQYLTSHVIAEALAARLQETDGPELVVVCPRRGHGWLERSTIDQLRGRFLDKLRRADRRGRFRVFHPRSDGRDVYVHAKVMVIDDTFVRVGSSNLTNRSMGFDSECDVAVADDDERPEVRRSIEGFRNRLVAEHLGADPEQVEHAVRAAGSLGAAVDRLRGGRRTLVELEEQGVDVEQFPGKRLIDPEQPTDPERLAERMVPPSGRPRARSGWLRIALTVIVLVALVGVWRLTPIADWIDWSTFEDQARRVGQHPLAPVAVVLVFLVASLVAFPITLLILLSVFVLGPWAGFGSSMAGCLSGAAAGYGLGRLLGGRTLRRLAGRRVHKLDSWLEARGLATVATLRVVPVAPFTVINLVAGASGIRFRDYLWGTALGMLPGIAAMSLFADRFAVALHDPSPKSVALVIALGAAFVTAVLTVRRLFRGRAARD
jgi:phosphatidylserine/phosphatidylglycerophosphate/cardiolipin synthase-like enzyme/uncharacterized membrane protein YdjX (TVP38/TMEM64 family)